jgi:hypothetical protein
MTYALDEARKTSCRGRSRATRPAESGQSRWPARSAATTRYIAYKWTDTNNDHFAQKNEVLTALGPLYWGSGIDITQPGSALPPRAEDLIGLHGEPRQRIHRGLRS